MNNVTTLYHACAACLADCNRLTGAQATLTVLATLDTSDPVADLCFQHRKIYDVAHAEVIRTHGRKP